MASCESCGQTLAAPGHPCSACDATMVAPDPALDATIAAPGLTDDARPPQRVAKPLARPASPHDVRPAERGAANPAAPPAKRARGDDALVGTIVLGQYVVREKLAEGGMGAVYLADQPAMGRTAVIKVLRPELCRSRESTTRFDVEARALSQLNDPHIVTIYNYGALDDGTLFLAMEHVEGSSLDAAMSADGPFSIERATSIARQIAMALAAMHEQQVVHRDLKPSNVMLVRRGETPDCVKILDFGVAKMDGVDLTMTGFALGTPRYMSPEQFSDGSIDGRSDLYSLGVTLFEMLAGKPPFVAGTPLEYMSKHVSEAAPRLREVTKKGRVPEALDALVGRLLAKRPADRPASAKEFLVELEAVLASRPPPAAPLAKRTAATVATAILPSRAVARVAPQPGGPSRVWSHFSNGFAAVQDALIASVRRIWERTGGRFRRRKTLRGSVTRMLQRMRPRRRSWLRARADRVRRDFAKWLRRLRRR